MRDRTFWKLCRADSSARRAVTSSRSWRSLIARSTIRHRCWGSAGLVRKSYAPSRIASTASFTLPYPVVTMTVTGMSRSRISRSSFIPSVRGIRRSVITRLYGRRVSSSSACPPSSAASTSSPRVSLRSSTRLVRASSRSSTTRTRWGGVRSGGGAAPLAAGEGTSADIAVLRDGPRATMA